MVELAGSEFNNPHPATNRRALCPPSPPWMLINPRRHPPLSSLLLFLFLFQYSVLSTTIDDRLWLISPTFRRLVLPSRLPP